VSSTRPHYREVDVVRRLGYELGIQLMAKLLGVTNDEAIGEIVAQWGGNVSIPLLKKLYKRHFSRCNELEDPADEEEEGEELRRTREYCLRAFLLLLVGVTIFANKSNKHISLI
jgi:hypothetical protein